MNFRNIKKSGTIGLGLAGMLVSSTSCNITKENDNYVERQNIRNLSDEQIDELVENGEVRRVTYYKIDGKWVSEDSLQAPYSK